MFFSFGIFFKINCAYILKSYTEKKYRKALLLKRPKLEPTICCYTSLELKPELLKD